MDDGTTYDVRVYRTEVYKGAQITTYWVRWKAGDKARHGRNPFAMQRKPTASAALCSQLPEAAKRSPSGPGALSRGSVASHR
jgi:hypothetical protein